MIYQYKATATRLNDRWYGKGDFTGGMYTTNPQGRMIPIETEEEAQVWIRESYKNPYWTYRVRREDERVQLKFDLT